MARSISRKAKTPRSPSRARKMQPKASIEFNSRIDELSREVSKPTKEPVSFKTDAQERYYETIRRKSLTFGIGPAGTGKTYIAVRAATDALLDGEVDSIVFTRPAVEAGEKLGFLPGEEKDKVAPWFAPLLIEMNKILGKSQVEALIKSGAIKFMPLAFMRGHAQPLSEPVLTSSGFVPMGDIKPGMSVIGSDGSDVLVTGIYPQGVKSVYKISFSDGESVLATADHLWLTQTRSEKRHKKGWSVKSTDQIVKSGIFANKHGSSNHEIPVLKSPVIFDSSENLTIDPYVLGCLLGDGHLHNERSVSFTTSDQEIVGLIQDRLPTDCSVVSRGKYNFVIRTPGTTKKRHDFRICLDEMGVNKNSSDKMIPNKYLFASPEDRLSLLQGLMDTDGSVFSQKDRSSRQVFYTTSPNLAEGVAFLVRSLGGVASMRTRNLKGNRVDICGNIVKANHDQIMVSITMPSDMNPFKLSRKANKFSPSRVMKFIVGVEEVGEDECQCISVDSEDHLYVANAFSITHNTFARAFIILDEAQNTTPSQMELLLTRTGEDSRVIVDGCMRQKDVAGISGLSDALKRLTGKSSVGRVDFGIDDIVRSGFVREVLLAYHESD